MNRGEQLEARREEILQELGGLRVMQRGSINEQYLKVRHKGQSEPVERGPYPILCYWDGQRTRSRRLTTPAQVEEARRAIAAYEHFAQLCQELVEIGEQLGQAPLRAEAHPDAKKKRSRWR